MNATSLMGALRLCWINCLGIHALYLLGLALDVGQFLTGLHVLKNDPIWPGRFLAWIDVNVEDPEQPTVKQSRFIGRTGRINNDLPLVPLGRPVNGFNWVFLETRTE